MKHFLSICAIGSLLTLQAFGGPELTGTPDELSTHLNGIPGQVTLSGEAEMKVEADRAELTVKVRNSDRSFKKALLRNQEMRSDIVAELEKSGIPKDRIQMAKFSSTPTQGFLKAKAYEIESRVTVEVLTEKEMQAAAGLVDEDEGISLQSLRFSNSQTDQHKAGVLNQALAKIKNLKDVYEKELGVKLVPRFVGPRPAPPASDYDRRRRYMSEDVSGIKSVLSNPEIGIILHALESGEPDISQFDQVAYKAKVDVTYDVVSGDNK